MHVQTTEGIEATEWNCGALGTKVGGAEIILFVEDETFVRDVTSEVLRSAGYAVLIARNAAEALSLYKEHRGRVDLLLTDVILPGENGRTLAHKLRLQNPALNVLFVTGYAEQMQVHETESADYLAKPFSTGILLRKVRELLDHRPAWTGKEIGKRIGERTGKQTVLKRAVGNA